MNGKETKAELQALFQGFRDLLFPPSCVHCGGLVQPEHGLRFLCEPCSRELHRIHEPACSTCGHPFFGVVHGERVCPHCLGLDPAFGHGMAAVLFKGPARSLIIELKYHRGLHLLHDIETVFRGDVRLLDFARGAQLVPVPLHARKRRERRYNQAELLANCLVRALDGQARVTPLLRRVVDTGSQTSLDREQRLDNLRQAFVVAPDARIERDTRYLLVDDVFTTGSTLNRCALALRRAGARVIDVCCLAHG